jgi:hypothetical protein
MRFQCSRKKLVRRHEYHEGPEERDKFDEVSRLIRRFVIYDGYFRRTASSSARANSTLSAIADKTFGEERPISSTRAKRTAAMMLAEITSVDVYRDPIL